MRNLNHKQRIVLGAGMFSLVVNFLFPPYVSEFDEFKHFVSYGFILDPPGPRASYDSLHNKYNPERDAAWLKTTLYDRHLNIAIWLNQGVVIVLVTLGALLAMASTLKATTERGRESEAEAKE